MDACQHGDLGFLIIVENILGYLSLFRHHMNFAIVVITVVSIIVVSILGHISLFG